jgi:hypothetical protein
MGDLDGPEALKQPALDDSDVGAAEIAPPSDEPDLVPDEKDAQPESNAPKSQAPHRAPKPCDTLMIIVLVILFPMALIVGWGIGNKITTGSFRYLAFSISE